MTNNAGDDKQPQTNIDRLVHEPARLMILAQLYVVESTDFIFLMRQTGLNQGNLSAHLTKLEAAGYVEITKEFVGKRPHTLLCLTQAGRVAFKKYVSKMKQLLDRLTD
jgi:DNA-binding MarR family transcriptional regulator